jgi:integrase
VTSKQRFVTETFHGNKREAQRRLARLITDVDEGHEEGANAKFGTLLDKWLEHLEQLDRSPATLREYRRLVDKEIRPKLGHYSLRKLSAFQLDRTYAQWTRDGLAGSSVRNRHTIISAACTQGVKWKWLSENPARKATPPPIRTPEIVPPTPKQIRQLIDASRERNPEMATFLWLAALLGARRGELCALRWGDVNWVKKLVRIQTSLDYPRGATAWTIKSTKTHSTRTVSLDRTALKVMKEHYSRCESRKPEGVGLSERFVFSSTIDGSEPWHPDSVSQFVGRRCEQLKMPEVHLHSLRHWMITTGLTSGGDVATIAGRAGHRDPSVTLKVYGHLLESADKAAANSLGRALTGNAPQRRRTPSDGRTVRKRTSPTSR